MLSRRYSVLWEKTGTILLQLVVLQQAGRRKWKKVSFEVFKILYSMTIQAFILCT